MNVGGRLKRFVASLLLHRGIVVAGTYSARQLFSPAELEVFQRVGPYTMTPPERVAVLIDAVTYITRRQIPGAIAECGVWRGGSMMAAALTLSRLGDLRELFLFDTFESMPAPTQADIDLTGASWQNRWHTHRDQPIARADLHEVQAALASTGYADDHLHYVKGRVEDTLPGLAPEQIALLRLDTDWYESTRHELEMLYPRLAPGGVLLIDDYGHLKGARQAVDEYFRDAPIFFARTDYAARVAIKPGPP